MNKIITKSILSLMLICSMSGCVTTLTNKQKESLTTVSITDTIVHENGYFNPNARKSGNLANAGGAAGGFIGSLIGSAIDASVMASQQSSFEDQNLVHFENIKNQIPNDLNNRIQQNIEKTLKEDEFFGSRLVDESANVFENIVYSYGLTIANKDKDDSVNLAFKFSVSIKLINGEKKIFDGYIIGLSNSSYTAKEYVNEPMLLNQVIDESATNVGINLSNFLDQKLGRK